MNAMTNQETDTALILENELQRRVTAVVNQVIHRAVKDKMDELFAQQKAAMLMEVSIAVGKMLRLVETEGRTPLWETDMAELGFGEVPTNHNIQKVTDALREQTPSV
jgi:spermidine/putrescine-binding protein